MNPRWLLWCCLLSFMHVDAKNIDADEQDKLSDRALGASNLIRAGLDHTMLGKQQMSDMVDYNPPPPNRRPVGDFDHPLFPKQRKANKAGVWQQGPPEPFRPPAPRQAPAQPGGAAGAFR